MTKYKKIYSCWNDTYVADSLQQQKKGFPILHIDSILRAITEALCAIAVGLNSLYWQ